MLEDIIKERIKKRDNLIKAGYDVYPGQAVKNRRFIGDVLRGFSFLSLFRRPITVGGRIMGMRVQGGIIFLDIKDESGKIQAILNKKSADDFILWKDNLDIGDFAVVYGTLFKTRKGERSVKVQKFTLAVKSLRPLPSEWHGLTDIEERYRKRYLDFLFNSDARNKIVKRFDIIRILRQILEKDGFLEVETPILQYLPGGALAKPFKTRYNAFGNDFYLRIAPELYLKRLLISGFEKIFEIGKNFRNEGIDRDHNPEFTMTELYWSYQDYEGLMVAFQKWLMELLDALKLESLAHNGETINFRDKWRVIDYGDAIRDASGKNWQDLDIKEMDEIFKKTARPKLIQPTFVVRYPKIISPLAKSCADNSQLTERFQLIVGGVELANGFSELNDPAEQRVRMEEQEMKYRNGDEEASRLDENFLEALEYGMPPAAGLGIGIDRLVALLTDTHAIKDIIAFPTLRPE